MEPGTRIMSPNVVKMTSGCSASHIASSTRPIGITQTGQPGSVHQLDGLRQQMLDAVPVDGVGVPAAHLHELELVAGGQFGDRFDQGAGGRRVPEFVDELHALHPLLSQAISDELNASISLT